MQLQQRNEFNMIGRRRRGMATNAATRQATIRNSAYRRMSGNIFKPD
jgi:hypothetical protein